ncbi:hypothetical protein E3Q22_01223 [Wallemia mellicola]|uniref:SnoaL-like domain-containing protein n=2 Tax=Wallemia mellicola TaxID=1708541 RepID=A0A4T0M6R8_9BASI|nr:hypothetical protein WALSEDRAFT_67606 [Wallemia mellicola CBS 633.66]TIB78499.1 hypothetical protein E3Q23_00701 [Wallemia mellicola]EIM23338.1 hypothetical protein WALSEDRAFT_67606 [Wallemia mellicola CBS 633.66]TIB81290.1 hypothetical protein E3Q22_01223 [Wallemia mellicola]TIB89075.1 hypothetical protein E3Q21_00704 [Wallemia mellicola]TIB91706.1 hypothetical protein E3Q20_00690 [Wallemia mellicola]|eukprot:XP_006956722.1 hypothetical protein WALSEDRAFT_67606 [Wallemia mellicola CBS 633.66]
MGDYERLLNAAKSFCESFGRGEELPSILSHFSPNGYVFEHGPPLPQLPYLGKTFEGQEEDELDGGTYLVDYFKLVNKYLNIENEPVWDGWSVDVRYSSEGEATGAIVTCKGEATFLNRKTGKRWDETSLYRMELDRGGRITGLDIWADVYNAIASCR